MIKRTLMKYIENQLKQFPVVVLTGPRQVGKSTLAYEFVKKHGFNYVSLDDLETRRSAIENPRDFIERHRLPLVIDEIQYGPILFDAVVSIVNEFRLAGRDASGLFILTGSQSYGLMQGVTETLAGRASITSLSGLSLNEIIGRDERVFHLDIARLDEAPLPWTEIEIFSWIIRGSFPELYRDKTLNSDDFYRNYIKTYIERDVTQLINIKDHLSFEHFMRILASQTGQELVYDSISKSIGKTVNTIKDWVTVLKTNNIIYLLEPYSERSITKRIVKRPKLYFTDTGLAAYLIRMNDVEQLIHSSYSGSFFETFVVNQIRLSFENNGYDFNAFYYRDNNQNEIDLILINKGVLQRFEIKKGIDYGVGDIKAFKQLKNTHYKSGLEGILCLSLKVHKMKDENYIIPISLI